MHFSNLFVFCGVSLLVCFTPGPAVLLAISNSVAVGIRNTVISSTGNALGLFIISGVAMAGMGAVLAVSATAFMVMKVIGALYLIYLGIKQWRSRANSFAPTGASLTAAAGSSQRRAKRLFGQGLMVALTNPKSILFFSALFPQFVTADVPMVVQYFVLTTIFTVCALTSHAFYVMLVHVLKGRLGNPAHARFVNRTCGALFVMLGLSLLRLRSKAG